MGRRRQFENTPRVVAVALGLFAFIYAAIPAGEVALVAGFGAAFALLACVADPGIRALWRPRSAQQLVRDLLRSRP